MIDIRKAGRHDASHIQTLLVALAEALGKPNDYRGTLKSIETYGFSDRPAFEVLLAWEGNTPIGLILYFFEFSTWRGKPGIYVQDLYVTDGARGTGLGRRLTAAAIARGHEEGAAYMRLSVHQSNVDGAAFYERTGFIAVDDEQIFVLEGAPFDLLAQESGS